MKIDASDEFLLAELLSRASYLNRDMAMHVCAKFGWDKRRLTSPLCDRATLNIRPDDCISTREWLVGVFSIAKELKPKFVSLLLWFICPKTCVPGTVPLYEHIIPKNTNLTGLSNLIMELHTAAAMNKPFDVVLYERRCV